MATSTGEGWADAILSTINASSHLGESVTLRLVYTGNTDGGEQFILASASAVPEPGPLLLVGSGLVGIGTFGRRHLAKYLAGLRIAP